MLGIRAVFGPARWWSWEARAWKAQGLTWRASSSAAEGLFGIALEVTVRLLTKPERFRTVLAVYHSLQTAGEAVARVVAAGLLPGAMEIMDALAIEAAKAAVHAGYPAGAARCSSWRWMARAASEEDFERLPRCIIAVSGPYEVRVAQDEADRMRIWKGRKSAFSAVGRLSPDYLVNDGVVPRRRLGAALAGSSG